MRRIISLAIVVLLSWSLFDDVLFAQKSEPKAEDEAQKKVIDLTADIVYPMTLNDTVEVMCLVGNFAAQHNGAIITADSAVRYSDKRLECFGNVLINQNTTYAYAESADYNGDINEINLYAPIVKVVDGDAVLYCYNFRYNTLDKVGIYEGGGVMINGESLMESITGYYFSDTHELVGVGQVELSGDEYQMRSDSIIYNTETEGARYFENTNIWNQKDEYLYADDGDYDKATDRYSFYLNGYILTEEQEMWSDSMDYFRASEHIYMRHNIQIDDTTQKSLIFGDFGEYIKTPGDMILVGRPSIINYDAEQGDSLFMRADTFEIFTLNRFVDESDTTAVASATEMARDIIENLDNDVEKSDSLAVEEHDHDHDHDHDQLVDAPLAPIIEEAVAPESPVVEEEPIETETEVEVEESETSETVETKSSTEIETAPTVEEPIVEQQSESVESPAPRPTQSPSSSEAASSTTTTPPPPGKGPGGGPRVGEGVGSGRGSEQNTSREVGRPPLSEMEGEAAPPAPDMFGEGDVADSLAVDSLATDSLRLDSLARAADTLNFWQRTKANYLAARKERAAAKAVEQAARKVVLDSIGRARQVKINEKLDAEKAREARRIAQRKSKVAIKTAHRVRRDVARGKIAPEDTIAIMLELAADSMELINLMMAQDSITVAKARVADSLAAVEAAAALDSLAFDRGREDVDSLAVDSLSADSVKIDSLYRLTKGYRNVKIYRSDFQAVADSMSTSSLDSIIRLYIDPVMWHGDNQVTSDVMDIYTANNQIEKAIFTGGSPIMASEVEKGRYYNQVAGKVITSLFEDGEVYRNDVDGNAQTIYYMQDDDTGDTNGLMIMYSGSATFYIEEQNVVGITYRGEPNYTLYPMNMIPKDQELTLKGFLWQSERQPTRDQVFDRTIRPTVREEMSTVPRPEFPIYEELNALREELMRSRLWIDRTDVVNAQAEEWMESLGYKTGQPREEKE